MLFVRYCKKRVVPAANANRARQDPPLRERRFEVFEVDRDAVFVVPIREQLALDDIASNYVSNTAEFECPLCAERIPGGDGIVLQDCGHELCKLVRTIF